MSRKSRSESRDFGTKCRGYQMSQEKAFSKVAGTKCRDVVKVLKSWVLNVANVAILTLIFLNFVQILTKISQKIKSHDDFFNQK